MTAITNQKELEKYITSKLNLALSDTVDELLNQLQMYIIKDVYDAYDPEWYDRTEEFYNSWVAIKPKISKIMVATIEQDTSLINWVQDNFQHGSNSPTWSNDNPQNPLAQIINSGNIGSAFGFPQLGARPFWTDFEKYCNANFYTIFKKNCAKHGLTGILT